jgi:hypothetical protein
MSQLRSISDRYEIEALRAAYTEALIGHQYSRVALLFTHDGRLMDVTVLSERALRGLQPPSAELETSRLTRSRSRNEFSMIQPRSCASIIRRNTNTDPLFERTTIPPS